jgi:hypothetical protein
MHSSHPSPRVSGSKSNAGVSHPHEHGDMRESGDPDIASAFALRASADKSLIRATLTYARPCTTNTGTLPSTRTSDV